MQYVFLIHSRAGGKKYVTYSAAPRDVFLTTSARAYQKHVLMGKRPFLYLYTVLL